MAARLPTFESNVNLTRNGLKATRELSHKDWRVIHLVAAGWNNKRIARRIGNTENVMKNRLSSIYDKLGVWSRLELALWYVKRESQGLVPLPHQRGKV